LCASILHHNKRISLALERVLKHPKWLPLVGYTQSAASYELLAALCILYRYARRNAEKGHAPAPSGVADQRLSRPWTGHDTVGYEGKPSRIEMSSRGVSASVTTLSASAPSSLGVLRGLKVGEGKSATLRFEV